MTGKAIPWKRYATLLAIYFGIFMCAVVAFWPLLWEQPLTNFFEAVHNMMTSQNQPGGLYFGKQIDRTPWHWVPMHFVTKTPLLYVGLFLIGVAAFLAEAIYRPLQLLTEHRDLLLFFSWFAIPLLIVIVLQADLFR